MSPSFEKIPATKNVPPEEAKKHFTEMLAAIDDPTGVGQEVPEPALAISLSKKNKRPENKLMSPRTGAAAMDEWQREKESREDKNFNL